MASTITYQTSTASAANTTNLATPVSSTQQNPNIPSPKRARITNRPIPHRTADPPARLPEAQMPYTGDYRGFSWNTQALFASRVSQQEAKQHHSWTILRDHDFGGLLETHGATGTVAAAGLPRHCRFFLGTRHQSTRWCGTRRERDFPKELQPCD